jgi:uncharacterized protein YndB with AHSA1/START domain
MDTHVIADRDLVMSRRIPAPPSEVFAAWTQPERIKQWFGPYCMTCPEAEVDLRPGGFHRALMRDAKGKDYPAYGSIDAVEAPHRLVMRVVDESCGPLIGAVGTLTFEPDGEGTLFTARYRDTVTMQGDDARVVTSEVRDTDGAWNLFMTARFKRIG